MGQSPISTPANNGAIWLRRPGPFSGRMVAATARRQCRFGAAAYLWIEPRSRTGASEPA
jgi:hypothetical protein